MLRALDDLVSIRSVTGTHGEKEAHEYLKDAITQTVGFRNSSGVGLKLSENKHEESSGDFRGYICADVHIGDDCETVALLGHYDVVPVSNNWTMDPFKLIQKEDKLYGRGSCDMKAGLAIMLELLKFSLESKPKKNIKFIFTSAEETGQPNGLTLAIRDGHLSGVDIAIALEPTNGEVNTGVFGYLDAEFVYTGVPCHSSTPDQGDNAIYKTGEIIRRFSQSPQPLDLVSSVEYNQKVLREALSITKISGGQASNIIPEQAAVQTNYRYSPDRSPQDVEEMFHRIAREVNASSLKVIEHNPASKILDIENPFLRRFMSQIGKRTQDLTLVPFWSDMSQASQSGVPSVNFGPGSIVQAHTDDEYVKRSELEKTYQLFFKYLFT